MKLYEKTVRAVFLSRPNRFIALCLVNGVEERCHVKNTGRCKELLVPGCTVVLSEEDGQGRKTKYDLVAVYKGEMLVNMDSQAPNRVFGEFAASGNFIGDVSVYPECTHGRSRLDFYMEQGERKIFCEIKGVTLENGGVCAFPDAPTERGRKHLRELTALAGEGYECCAVFVVQMEGMRCLVPNEKTDPEFAVCMRTAANAGVKLLAYECAVQEQSMSILRPIPVALE